MTRTASNRSERASAPRARSMIARRKLTDRSMSSMTCPSSSSSSSRRPAATSVQRPSDSIAIWSPARAAVSGFASSCAMMPGRAVVSWKASGRAVVVGPAAGSRRSSRPRHSPASSSVKRSRLRRSRPSGGGAGGRMRTGATTHCPSAAPRHPTQRLPCTIAMFQRRRVASTSSLLVWWVGAGSLEAWGSSSARAETSQTVTGRPPRATLACRRISRLPSTNGSRCVIEAPRRARPPLAGKPHERPPVTTAPTWNMGARITYATNRTARQATGSCLTRLPPAHSVSAPPAADGLQDDARPTPLDAPLVLRDCGRAACRRAARAHGARGRHVGRPDGVALPAPQPRATIEVKVYRQAAPEWGDRRGAAALAAPRCAFGVTICPGGAARRILRASGSLSPGAKRQVKNDDAQIVRPSPRPARVTVEGPRDREHLRTVVVRDYDDLALLLAERIVAVIARATAANGRCVLGLATGSTPLGIYRELIRSHQAGQVDFARVVTFNLDEYYPMPPDSPHAYRRYMWENLFAHVNVRPENVHIPDGGVRREDLADQCAAYERAIAEAGGIDFQLLGIGKSGHVGFNEPGSSQDSRTRPVILDTVTRKDAAADFFGEDNVPREAISMGVATILEAREIALLATGEHKAAIVARAVEGDVSQDVAATFLQRHPNATAYLDLAAAAELTRIRTPWVLGGVSWTPELTERATVWLAEQTGKAVLKLAARDYAEHHLSPLLAQHGAPGPINGFVFNRLRDKIRGRRKLPSRKSVLVFSPHPDDDVISMGGVLRKLWENENTVVVAYMTSGNIAVFDHDVRRHLDFVSRAAETLGLDRRAVARVGEQVEASFAGKAPGDVDLPVVQDLKRMIRESEAIAALDALGIPASAARFLNLPFYRTGEVRKHPIGPEDVALVRALLEQLRPDLVFVAGDLSDPHGTHRSCKLAILRALEHYAGPRPEVWLYRGAWQEWSLTEADVLVPLSQDELRAKILAIFKHQSQKDTAPFPGGYDDREFWQRVEARNVETAARADRLGLPEYFAMEAYVVNPDDASG